MNTISHAASIRTSNPAAHAWSALRRYQNVDFVAQELISKHQIPPKWTGNAKKQARQIRQCLIQAREYFTAAQAVTSATKPNLLYYGTMSLALAELLYKQSGDSSLDRARDNHRHHGLTMTVSGKPNSDHLQDAASRLLATPLEISGNRRGTFELWQRTSREHPLAGVRTFFVEDSLSSTSRFETILEAEDAPFSGLDLRGITLHDCFLNIPFMADHLFYGARLMPAFARGQSASNFWPGPKWREITTVTFHPGENTQSLISNIKTEPAATNRIDFQQISTGLRIKISDDYINGQTIVPFPPATMLNTKEWLMWKGRPPLSEFGFIYAAIYLAGNYAVIIPITG